MLRWQETPRIRESSESPQGRTAPSPACFLHRSLGLDGVMAKHPPLGYPDGLAWRHQVEGADLDPLRVDRGHGGFEVTEPLLLLVKACQARLFEETSFDLGWGAKAGGVGCSAMEGAIQLPDQPFAGLVSL